MNEDNNPKREDDLMLRKLAVGIASAIFIQAIGWVYMLGVLSNQVENNTKSINSLSILLEEQREINSTMIRIHTLVEGLGTSVNRLTDRIESVANEQNRRALIIDRADRFMENHTDNIK